MKRLVAIILSFSLLVPFAFADEGMWTFDNPPMRQWKERYGFEPSQEFLDNIRLASPKVGGASGGFVSPNGLILTNHHVAANWIARVSTKERDLMKTGFYAATLADEIKIPDAEVTILASYLNVTERIRTATQNAKDDTESARARGNATAMIEKDCSAETRLRCQVVPMYSGGEYWLYRFKVYNDVRLVMAPEEQAAFFGGDYDNFTYPRHDLDFTFLRAYENDKPASTPNYLKWSKNGAADGEFILVSGYPGSTARLLTVAQLSYQRELGNPIQKRVWELRKAALDKFARRGSEEARLASQGIRSFSNSLKRLDGQQDGLLNPRNFSRKEAEEKDLRDKLKANAELERKYASAWPNISAAYEKLPTMANRLAFSNVAASRLATIAQQIVTYHVEAAKPDSDRYAEYKESRIAGFKNAIMSPASFNLEYEAALLTDWLSDARSILGADDPFIKAALGSAEPSEVVGRAIRETALKDPAARKALADGPANAIAASTDPLVTLARRIEPVVRELRDWNEKNILNVETANGTRIAEARFAVYGKTMPPDANSQLRILYGKVLGYDEDTTLVPYKTTFFGLYDRALSFNEKHPFDLTDSLRSRRDKVDLATPLNFVYTADTIGGNSGSPVINRNGEIVGVNFDSNLQKLSNRYWYIEENEGSRAVGVHSAGIMESLKKIYDAERVVVELGGN